MSRIVHFGKYYFPDVGGIEHVTLSMARGAAAHGHDVTVICFQAEVTNPTEIIDGVRVIRTPIDKIAASQPLGWRYVKACLSQARNADVIHLHAPNMLAALICLFVSRKTKVVTHWHSDVINKRFLGLMLKPLERAVLRRSDRIIATSSVYIEGSQALPPFREKISVIPIGVSDPAQKKTQHLDQPELPHELRQRLINNKLILAVGRLVPYKGFDVLIKAAKHLQLNTVVIIVGTGPLATPLQQAIDKAGVGDRVYLAGRLEEKVLHQLFSQASLFCLPSIERSEAFGVVLLEAMAYGLPIVATDIAGSGVPWVNKNGISGLNVPVSNPTALAVACNTILGSKLVHTKLSTGARNRFLSEFTEEIAIARINAVYKSLLGL